jgi:hypothetical protein
MPKSMRMVKAPPMREPVAVLPDADVAGAVVAVVVAELMPDARYAKLCTTLR